ncbi:hypothetical protein [Sporosarcina sp. FSL W7-1283]|uniref:hypothetical protein n=1 Tax=Sporosarcina sp. FSL W7-1283 TaxID=2921560 RepID=UPI0030FA78E9
MEILKPHEVVVILDKPEQCEQRIVDIVVEYWSVSAVMKNGNDVYTSVITFEALEEAQKLKVGDVFMR